VPSNVLIMRGKRRSWCRQDGGMCVLMKPPDVCTYVLYLLLVENYFVVLLSFLKFSHYVGRHVGAAGNLGPFPHCHSHLSCFLSLITCAAEITSLYGVRCSQ
jgi:hypothetical protein